MNNDKLFFIIQIITVAIFFVIGALLYRIETTNILETRTEREASTVTFVMDEPREKKKIEPPRPVARPQVDTPVEEIKRAEPEPPRERQVRQVYGLRKVFSQGLGAGGSDDDAIVGRIGNTLDRNADTSTATADDLRGRPVANPQPANVPTKPPRLAARFRRMRPQYSQEMLQHRVEGVVRARILVGADGAVRRVEILEDIGFDSAEIARDFLMGLTFEPAMRGDEAVSVWIPFSIRFELVA